MYLSATCCSRLLAVPLAIMTSSAVTSLAPLWTAMSPETLMSPPSSLILRVSSPFLPERRWASRRISATAYLSKWGILPSFLTSWATNLVMLSRFSSVSGIELRMYTS